MRLVRALKRAEGPAASSTSSDFEMAVVEGLSAERKSLPCRFLYDAAGSALFEEITRLPEYYPTRTEMWILATFARDMLDVVDDGATLVEFGSGSSIKTEILLRHLPATVSYVPIDVSEAAISLAAARLATGFPRLRIRPVIADFSIEVRIPPDLASSQKLGFFPGSTIGNLAPSDAIVLLERFRAMLGAGARLIIGVDLKKDVSRLLSAYNDPSGVTAAFNLNLLARINRELGAAVHVGSFEHRAIYNAQHGRIEMHLVSTRGQVLEICGRRFEMSRGETIHTENSYKYSIDEFRDLARAAGWSPHQVWCDPETLFSVHELR